MKRFISLFTFACAGAVIAGELPPLGNFQGLAFSSATMRHALEIQGGTPVNCQVKSNFHECDIQGGLIRVAGVSESRLNVGFTRVLALRGGETKEAKAGIRWHYYYKGETELSFGARVVKAPVVAIFTVEDENPNRVFGLIELREQAAKTTFEAYRIGND